MIVRDLHKLCIEVSRASVSASSSLKQAERMSRSQDPFALDYNVARTVTKDGLYTVRSPLSLDPF